MVNEQLYKFVKTKSSQVPIAIIRNSLIRHGYPRIEVDEAVRKVILEQQEHSKLEEKTKVFHDFGGKQNEDVHLIQPTKGEAKSDYVTLDQIKPKPQNVISQLKKTILPKPKPLMEHIVRPTVHHELQEQKPDDFVDLEQMKKESAQKVKEEHEERVKRIIHEEQVKKEYVPAIQEAVYKEQVEEPIEEPAETIEEKTIKIHEEMKQLPKVKTSLGLKVHFRAVKNAFLRGWSQIDQIKFTYFLIALFAVIAILTSLIFPNTFMFNWSIKLILGSTVTLMIAHNLKHLEKKYDLNADRKNSFELSVAMGGVGWLLSSILRPGTLFLLIIPAVIVFAYLVQEIYKTTLQIAIKVSALTTLAGLFAFYGVAIVMGLLVGVRTLL